VAQLLRLAGLEVGTSYESALGRIAVSFHNEGVYASTVDLVTVLRLPLRVKRIF
jgi:hypothetical protein